MSDFKVPIKNVLYMYSYIWDKVDKNDITKINANDDFTSIDIYAELFLMNVNKIIKKGLYKQYNEKNEEIKSIKGKIDFKLSINNLSFRNAKAFCTYDELENNNIYNQIIKSTAIKIYRTSNLDAKLKSKVNDVLLYFNQVNFFEIKKNDFINLRFNKNNLYYYYILKICELINDNLMLSNDDGNYEFKNLFDDEKNMHNIFELFINKFYKCELENSYNVYYR
jgi:5-methylcytosine-specific restriction enzyme subunit McrC